MAVPKFFMFFKPFLEAITDGELYTTKEVRQSIDSDFFTEGF